jgi:hypothetical protein
METGMNTATRLVSYAAALAVVFGGAWAAGSAFGSPPPPASAPMTGDMTGDTAGDMAGMAGMSDMAPADDGRTWQGDGFQVRLDGDLVAGASSQVFATVSRDGIAVDDLEPDGTGFGRLMGVRTSDLAYLPVRNDGAAPAPGARGGPSVAFVADDPLPGAYKVYLDFRHAGVEHTASFTIATRGTS